ncbi:MAG TPA: IPT/TIG domain-containing protein [Candidatus Acidoferrales bacterium]|nr:IPT/TIG domain-containing protein [Candidatus Acidoferrales bacterium]
MKVSSLAVIFALVSAGATVAGAATTVWAFNASLGNPHIQAYDLATGNAVADFAAPHKDAQRNRANGRGIAVVGTAIYYTLADTPNVYKTDAVTHADLGIAFTTPLTPGINSLAWDGHSNSFWMVSSQPADPKIPADDKVYQFSLPTQAGAPGTLLQTLVLPRQANSNLARNGLEVTPSGIVANQGSVPYDIFDFSGNLTHPAFITATFRTAGIAFDGVDYIVSDVANGRLAIFDSKGAFQSSVALTGSDIPFGIVDLAVVPSQPAAAAPQFSSAGVVAAASYVPGAIAPGEIITIFGSGMGPDTLAPLQLNAAGLAGTTLAGTRVLFDGVPAPVVYTANTQLSVVVPYSVAAKSSVSVVVEYLGAASGAVTMPVTPSAPGIFTADGSGAGPGAILNEDGITLNSAASPAGKGSVVTIFASGEGQTNPGGVDGKLAVAPWPSPLLPVSVDIGNAAAVVLYAGAAPTLVAGLFQVNVVVPADAPSPSASVVLHVGNAASQPGVTLAIQ